MRFCICRLMKGRGNWFSRTRTDDVQPVRLTLTYQRFTTRNAFLNLAKATPFDIVTQERRSKTIRTFRSAYNLERPYGHRRTRTSTEPLLKPSDILPRKKTYPYYYGIREWLTQTMEENKFDGAILSSEMFLYGNGYWSIGMLIDQPIRIDFSASRLKVVL